ncbi:MAG: proton-conducting transporter membrane subunit [Candidatus Binatus sp.]|uniref:proton-conducting transporter transmembrane domain-containing protein n=1 Tax=Candidatus Binatus sp. TaxID=2811406 RepID=UPI0027193F64|nr:proton-conducting transporter membrane subunit [Candidatus Binatus sp.]MDO8432311.1 proton-conducting transporter membrane subunit [Candidatus Binatus sp.]
MMLALLVIFPASMGVIALKTRNVRVALAMLLGVSAAHLCVTLSLWAKDAAIPPGAVLGLDVAGIIFLSITSVLFLVAAVYCVPYLLAQAHEEPGGLHLFVPCLLWFLAAMTLVTVAQNLAMLWAAIEATTLASAPLIYFHRRKEALEATWKYLMICSVGIALALLGTFFLGVAATVPLARGSGLSLPALIQAAPHLSRRWLEGAFVFALVGYGTKMGLAPLHTWLPDAHSQAPAPVSALLSGALLNCAFLGIFRFFQILAASGNGAFARTLLLLLGFTSLGVAAALMVRQRDYKRLLAYSSIENMGVIAIGVGLGGPAVFGALLHAVNHSLCKAGLFLLSGNVLREFGTASAGDVRGVLRRLPGSGMLLMTLLFALGGTPPFGLFVSEFTIFAAAIRGTQAWLGPLFAALLAIAFLGTASVLLPMLQADGSSVSESDREPWLSVATPLVLGLAVLILGLYVPAFLSDRLHRAAMLLGG